MKVIGSKGTPAGKFWLKPLRVREIKVFKLV
jgi:hypothetical protein